MKSRQLNNNQSYLSLCQCVYMHISTPTCIHTEMYHNHIHLSLRLMLSRAAQGQTLYNLHGEAIGTNLPLKTIITLPPNLLQLNWGLGKLIQPKKLPHLLWRQRKTFLQSEENWSCCFWVTWHYYSDFKCWLFSKFNLSSAGSKGL